MKQKTNPLNSLKIVFAVVIFLAIVQVFVSNRLVSLDSRRARILSDINQLEKENDDYRQKVASFSALATIAGRAEESGFTQTGQYMYTRQEYPVALDKRR